MSVSPASGAVAGTSATAGTVTSIPGIDRVGPMLLAALACADAALEPQVGRSALYPGGQVAYDDCCDGQVWVRLISLTPTANPPNVRTSALPCGVLMWSASIGIGALRCAATLDTAGNAPTPTQLNADTLQMTADMAALSEAIQCCLAPQTSKVTMVRWNPLGPDGGCVGGEWVMDVLVDNCGCP